MRILTAEAMRGVENRAIEELGIPGLILMENAALGVVDALAEAFPRARRVVIFCGPGNNGGDGFAVGRHLSVRGYEVELVLVRGPKSLTGDAAVQWEICQRMGLAIEEIREGDPLGSALEVAASCDLVVDALLGTGLTRPLEGHFRELVLALSALPVPCLAVDLPSGLDADSPFAAGPHIQAEQTVTFAAPKVAHIFPPAADAMGELVVADLGIPSTLVAQAEGDLSLLLRENLVGSLASRPAAGHKGTFGHLLLVAGSLGKAGAAILAARGAVRGGAGLVTVAVPLPLRDLVDGGSLESMTLGVPALPGGSLGRESAPMILAAAESMTAVALGPGLGQDQETQAVIRDLVLDFPLPLVLDADGLNAFAGCLGKLSERTASTILTPHPGELGRLLGCSTQEVVMNRLDSARDAARRSGAIVVLKGERSLIARPDGGISVNPTGNAGLATGGSGDVLTGLLGALLAQGYDPVDGACVGTFLHGAAGDLVAAERGPEALAAGDLAEALGSAFEGLRQGSEGGSQP